MKARTMRQFRPLPVLLVLTACGGGSPSPTTPSSSSFLTGTWRGTVRSRSTRAIRELQRRRVGRSLGHSRLCRRLTSRRFEQRFGRRHSWLPVTTTASTALTPGNTAPAQISTQGQFDSPRGCRGTFGSVGTANASRIEADFTGVDCNQATFTGSVVLTKN